MLHPRYFNSEGDLFKPAVLMATLMLLLWVKVDFRITLSIL